MYLLWVAPSLELINMEPLPPPSSSVAMLLPAVVLAALGLGPWVRAALKLKLPVEEPDSVSLERNRRPSQPKRRVWAERMRVFSTANKWLSKPGKRVSPCWGLPRL